MAIRSKPASKVSRAGHLETFGHDHGHVNAACCTCPKCRTRRDFNRKTQYVVHADMATGVGGYAVSWVKVQ